MRIYARVLSTAAALLALAACSEPPAGPGRAEPGTLTVSLASPNADDRAIVIRVRGPGVMREAVSASESYLVHARAAGDSLRAAAFGPLASGALLTFTVPDVKRAAEYRATVVEASDESNALRADVSGYAVTVGR